MAGDVATDAERHRCVIEHKFCVAHRRAGGIAARLTNAPLVPNAVLTLPFDVLNALICCDVPASATRSVVPSRVISNAIADCSPVICVPLRLRLPSTSQANLTMVSIVALLGDAWQPTHRSSVTLLTRIHEGPPGVPVKV